MNCHYSAQGEYKCAKSTAAKPAATTTAATPAATAAATPVAAKPAAAKFANVYFASESSEGALEGDEERFTSSENYLDSPSSENSFE